MDNISHISLDVWNTLLIPNPEYSTARNEYLAEHFNVTLIDAKHKFTRAKNTLDDFAEKKGISLFQYQVYALLLNTFGSENFDDIPDISAKFIELFRKYPPTLLEETKNELQRISQNGKISLGIISNTNFINGDELYKTIKEQSGIEFNSPVFSDLVGFAKPSKGIFSLHFEAVKCYNKSLSKDVCVHIGDSVECDILGAMKFGFKNIWCQKPQNLSKILQGF